MSKPFYTDIRIVTYNINRRAAHVRPILDQMDADILCLQEVYLGTLPILKEATDLRYGIIKPSINNFGNAILSRYPISDIQHQVVTVEDREPRSILSVVILHPTKPFRVGVLHLDHNVSLARMKQVEAMRDMIGQCHFVVGDFNAVRLDYVCPEGLWDKEADGVIKYIEELGFVDCMCEWGKGKKETMHVSNPVITIDYIFKRHDFEVIGNRTIVVREASDLSDHFPVLFDFKME